MGPSKLRFGLLAMAGWVLGASVQAAVLATPPIQLIDYDWGGSKFGAGLGGLSCPGNPPSPPSQAGCSLDQTLALDNLKLGEHFRGQSLTRQGNADVLGSHTGLGGQLDLQAGEAGKNLAIVDGGADGVLLGGVGPGGSNGGVPNFSALGTGAVSLLFNNDQSKFGFRLHNWDGFDEEDNASILFLAFFDFQGNLIGEVLEWSLPNDTLRAFAGGPISLAFGRTDGTKDIAGVSIWNSDDLGMQISGMQHDQDGVRDPVSVPTPGALLLAGLALVAAGTAGRRRKA